MSDFSLYKVNDLKTPVMAFALHEGHAIAASLRPYQLLTETQRSREEDPYTGDMIQDLPVTTVRVRHSRFQLDLNRTRQKSVYLRPEDAWGLRVWDQLPEKILQGLYRAYDEFYTELRHLIQESIRRSGYFLILDIHSYNHRRDDPFRPADVHTHPAINMGTAFNLPRWQPICAEFTSFLADSAGWLQSGDVRQNIVFKGGAFAQWVLKNYGGQGAVFSIEFKKTFMDEWTGILDIEHFNRIRTLLAEGVKFLNTQYKALP